MPESSYAPALRAITGVPEFPDKFTPDMKNVANGIVLRDAVMPRCNQRLGKSCRNNGDSVVRPLVLHSTSQVVVRTNTVARRGEAASLSPEGRDQ